MRAAFVAGTGFCGLLSVLCLVKTATVVPDQAQVVRWLTAALGFAFVAVFWELVRRRYVVTGSLRADRRQALFGIAAIAALVLVLTVFAATG